MKIVFIFTARRFVSTLNTKCKTVAKNYRQKFHYRITEDVNNDSVRFNLHFPENEIIETELQMKGGNHVKGLGLYLLTSKLRKSLYLKTSPVCRENSFGFKHKLGERQEKQNRVKRRIGNDSITIMFFTNK